MIGTIVTRRENTGGSGPNSDELLHSYLYVSMDSDAIQKG